MFKNVFGTNTVILNTLYISCNNVIRNIEFHKIEFVMISKIKQGTKSQLYHCFHHGLNIQGYCI